MTTEKQTRAVQEPPGSAGGWVLIFSWNTVDVFLIMPPTAAASQGLLGAGCFLCSISNLS